MPCKPAISTTSSCLPQSALSLPTSGAHPHFRLSPPHPGAHPPSRLSLSHIRGPPPHPALSPPTSRALPTSGPLPSHIQLSVPAPYPSDRSSFFALLPCSFPYCLPTNSVSQIDTVCGRQSKDCREALTKRMGRLGPRLWVSDRGFWREERKGWGWSPSWHFLITVSGIRMPVVDDFHNSGGPWPRSCQLVLSWINTPVCTLTMIATTAI